MRQRRWFRATELSTGVLASRALLACRHDEPWMLDKGDAGDHVEHYDARENTSLEAVQDLGPFRGRRDRRGEGCRRRRHRADPRAPRSYG